MCFCQGKYLRLCNICTQHWWGSRIFWVRSAQLCWRVPFCTQHCLVSCLYTPWPCEDNAPHCWGCRFIWKQKVSRCCDSTFSSHVYVICVSGRCQPGRQISAPSQEDDTWQGYCGSGRSNILDAADTEHKQPRHHTQRPELRKATFTCHKAFRLAHIQRERCNVFDAISLMLCLRCHLFPKLCFWCHVLMLSSWLCVILMLCFDAMFLTDRQACIHKTPIAYSQDTMQGRSCAQLAAPTKSQAD